MGETGGYDMKVRTIVAGGMMFFLALVTTARANGPCAGLPDEAMLRAALQKATFGTDISGALGPGTGVGGLFGGHRMWAAVVNREGRLCAYVTSTNDPADTWPGSQAIAKAKAYTANAFSTDNLPLSTARLYTFVQPGHSLYGLNNSNPFNPEFLAPPSGKGGGRGRTPGGIITFGGGVPLYASGIVGGLGVSGDTACADHEIAKRVRDLLGFNPPGGPLADDIVYTAEDGPSVFAHSPCVNNMRNGVNVVNEAP